MVLAVEAMDPTLQFVFFLVAVVLFIVQWFVPRPVGWIGLASFAVPFMWNALAAS